MERNGMEHVLLACRLAVGRRLGALGRLRDRGQAAAQDLGGAAGAARRRRALLPRRAVGPLRSFWAVLPH